MNTSSNLISMAFVCLLFALATNSYANQWLIDAKQSQLNFVTTKQTHIAEVNRFNSFYGSLDANGAFNLVIDLASVDTNVQIRDDRIRKFLFHTDTFSSALLTAIIDIKMVDTLNVGEHRALTVNANLQLHDKAHPVTMSLSLIKLTDNQLIATSAQPVLVNAADFSLLAGIEKLRSLVGLSSITHTVPVTFYLVLLKHTKDQR